jgi:uncharacterized protein (TIGR03437 family)
MSDKVRNAMLFFGLLGFGIAAQAATTIWAGTSIGLFKSIDGGAGWQFVTITNSNPALQGAAQIMAVALDPQQPATVYFVATVGRTAGFFQSADNGATWSAATLTGASLTQGSTWLAIDPVLTNVIYLSSDTLRRSMDYGATWSVISIAGAPAVVRGFGVDPSASGTIYATSGPTIIQKSTDFGDTWTQLTAVNQTPQDPSLGNVIVDPRSHGTLYVGNAFPFARGNCGSVQALHSCGLFKSADSGMTWKNVAQPGVYLEAAFDSRTSDLYVAASLTGVGISVLKSSDGGDTWIPVFNQGGLYALHADPGAGSTVFGFAYPAGPGFFKSSDAGKTWTGVMLPAQPIAGTITVAVPELSSMALAKVLGNVSAASFQSGPVAPESIATALGFDLATAAVPAPSSPAPTTLGGTTVTVVDAHGTSRLAPLFYVAPGQVNYEIPAGTVPGVATITVKSGDGVLSIGPLGIAPIAPGLFTLNGAGLVAAYALRVSHGNQTYENVYDVDSSNAVTARPVNLGPAGDQVYLLLFGTGLRGATDPAVTIGGVSVPVLYAGAQGQFDGEDQVNVGPLPRSLADHGNVALIFTAGGKTGNTVNVTIQ